MTYEVEIVTKDNRTYDSGAKITDLCVHVSLPKIDYVYPMKYVGVDPGQVNMGVAILDHISGNLAHIFQITLPSTIDTVERILQTVNIVDVLIQPEKDIDIACVESAAYAALYGQVALAENRTSAIVSLLKAGVREIVTPAPGSIRKEVFGSAKQRAEETWPHLPKDAASALCCALYALRLGEFK